MESIRKLWENFDYIKDKKEQSCLNAIKNGQKVSESFWEDFIRVSNNIHDVSKLLNVSPDKIREWNKRIKKYLEDAKKINKDNIKIRKSMIHTGKSLKEQENN